MAARSQINDQLMPARAGGARWRVGMGDFTSQPQYQQSVSLITNQMQSEGQNGFTVAGALSVLQDTTQSMLDKGLSAGDALNAATSYVMSSQTLGGAVDIVSDLVTAAQSGVSPVGLANMFTGTMVGIMVLAGGASAGVGAAIVAGVGAVLSLMQSAGLFGSTPNGTTVCSCNGTTTTATDPIDYSLPGAIPWGGGTPYIIAVSNDALWDPQHASGIAPGATNWRSFPGTGTFWQEAASGSAVWYAPWAINPQWQPPGTPGLIQFVVCPCPNFAHGVRLVDIAFPQFHHMECEAAAGAGLINGLANGDAEVAQALTGFEAAFFAALRLNWEYALNGLKPPASDAQVLVHTIYNWNRAHAPGTGFDIQPVHAVPWAPNGTVCDGSVPPWYAGILAPQAGNVVQPPGVTNGSLLHINTGARLNFSVKNKVSGGWLNPGGFRIGGTNVSASSSSTAANVALGAAAVAGAGLLGAFLYARHKRTTTKAVLKTAWGKTGGRIHVPHHLPKLLGRKKR